MKAYIKRISALVLAVTLCFALCSCSTIKEMRASQAFYGEGGEIIWGGQVYKPLEISELPEELELYTSGWGSVTANDVPVLLSDVYGTDMYYNHNKTLIEAGVYYAREDVYDYVKNLIKYPYLNDYCVEIQDEWTLEASFDPLKERYLNTIDEIIYGGNEVYDNDDYYDAVTSDYADIYACDEKMVFQSLVYRVEENENGEMYLSTFVSRDMYDYDENIFGVYRIPEDKKAMMKELITLGEDELN